MQNIRFNSSAIDRFWKKVDKRSNDECWNWTASKLKGYGLLKVGRDTYRAHRFSYELHSGEKIPPGLCCLHRCDNPSCVNPLHLFLGTHQDNMDDREKKRRGVRLEGEKHGQCKLTTSQVNDIRTLYATGNYGQTELGRMFGVTKGTIRHIIIYMIRKNG